MFWCPGIPVVHPAVVAAGAVDRAVRGHGGGGHRGQPRRDMDSARQQTDEKRH